MARCKEYRPTWRLRFSWYPDQTFGGAGQHQGSTLAVHMAKCARVAN